MFPVAHRGRVDCKAALLAPGARRRRACLPLSTLNRPYPTRLPPLEYPGHYEVRRVSRNGGIRLRRTWVNVSQTLGGERIGLTEIDDGEWDVYFGPLRLGRFHERTLTIEDALGRQYRRRY